MKELVVVSGKGGTGKTSLTACLASLAKDKVMADCDVDAADLHLILEPTVCEEQRFLGSKKASIQQSICSACGRCLEICRFGAVLASKTETNSTRYVVDPVACESCGVCSWFCPEKAITLTDGATGKLMVSVTRHGPMVHAALGAAEENSGKLVAQVRSRARQLAEDQGLSLIIVDGPPGIGCPVIASITGADLVLVVTEPTPSGLHDLRRILSLTDHFEIPTVVCVNKYDLSPSLTETIRDYVQQKGLELVGTIRYDPSVTQAQVAGKSVVEFTSSGVSDDIRSIWQRVSSALEC